MALNPVHLINKKRLGRILLTNTVKNQGRRKSIEIYDKILRIVAWNARSIPRETNKQKSR